MCSRLCDRASRLSCRKTQLAGFRAQKVAHSASFANDAAMSI